MKEFKCLKDYKKMFKAEVFIDSLLRPCYRSLKTKEVYKLFNSSVEEINKLIKQSLKQGKDLLFEECKDAPYSLEERVKDMEKAGEYALTSLLYKSVFQTNPLVKMLLEKINYLDNVNKMQEFWEERKSEFF